MTLRLHALAVLLFTGAAHAGCTVPGDRPGPFYACQTGLSSNWEIEGGVDYCTCDPSIPPPTEPARIRLIDRSWHAEVVAPRDSLQPGTRVEMDVAGHRTSSIVLDDGSVRLHVSWTIAARGDPGPGPSHATLYADRRYTVWFPFSERRARPHPRTVAPDGDERFPEGAWAIEDPPGTMDVRVRALGASLVGIDRTSVLRTHFEWIEGVDGAFHANIPGGVGAVVSMVVLWPDHTASCGGYMTSFCHCSRRAIEANTCDMDAYPWFAPYGTVGDALDVLFPEGDVDTSSDGGVDARAPIDYPDANADGGLM